ncbi:MAG TPA: UPF0182 family protein [Mycobacteriales bacterium]|nr:UPF0182 family protein [Mycobacteriales bacterium]
MKTAPPPSPSELVATAPPKAPVRATLRKLRPLAVVAVAGVVIYAIINLIVSVYTNWLWFDSVHEIGSYRRRVLTQVVMFLVFGGAAAVAVAVNLVALHRHTPYDGQAVQTRLSVRLRYARWIYPRRRLATAVVSLAAGLWVGLNAAARWTLWLQWRNATSFGIADPQFHRDYSYYVFVYPMHRYALTASFRIVVLCVILLAVAGYLNGGFRPRGERPRLAAKMRVHVCLLLGVLALMKALAYWLDRFATAVSNRGVVTGPSYTDIHAVLPSKLILLVIAVLLAVLFFVNMAFRSWKATTAGVVTLMLSGVLFGGVVPWVVQQYHVKPDAQDAEALSIARDIAATKYAYGIGAATVTSAGPATGGSAQAGDAAAAITAAQPQLLDPNQMSPTFTQLQQVRAFYGFKNTLDVDRYDIGGVHDVALAVRELRLAGLPSGQRTWSNLHLVYTHGYGVVAAPVDAVQDGTPKFVEADVPPTGALGTFEPRIYFGQSSPSYSLVGAPANVRPHEFDRPGAGGGQVDTTYTGNGGVPVGSFWRQLVYAWRMGDKNILFSAGVNSRSRLLYIRDPRQRVRTVAPWLTLDGAAYPVVAGGRVLWVVDGYTTANSVPYSQQQNLRAGASDSYVTNGSTVAQPGQSINYIRNSVKATVDAYDGSVHLYQWDNETGLGRDPVLATWMKAFPGLVQPATAMPAEVRAHLRYPRDLFNVQRTMLARYHVSDPRTFYNGSDFWRIPSDPTVKGSAAQPPYYLRLPTSGGQTEFSLASPFVSLNGRAMTAYLSVGADPGSGYGRMRLQTLPAGVEGPGQIRNDIESDPGVAQQLTLLRGGGSRVVLGNLQPIPADGSVIWVEPIYSRAAGGTSFPILRRVVVVRGGTIAFEPTLNLALADAVGNGATPGARLARAVAAAQQAQARAQAALAANNRTEYERQERLLEAALAAIAASQPNG